MKKLTLLEFQAGRIFDAKFLSDLKFCLATDSVDERLTSGFGRLSRKIHNVIVNQRLLS